MFNFFKKTHICLILCGVLCKEGTVDGEFQDLAVLKEIKRAAEFDEEQQD